MMSRIEIHGWIVLHIPVRPAGVGEGTTATVGAGLAFGGNWLPA
jgi:hypothetical protein